MCLIFTGCRSSPKPDWQGVCRVRPIILTFEGKSNWTIERLRTRQAITNSAYAHVGLKFDFLPVEYMEHKELFDIEGNETRLLYKISKERADRDKELIVFLVNSLSSVDGIMYGGLANYPSNLFGSIYQHGVLLSSTSSNNALAHEIGHALNLYHTWKDKFSDTPSNDKRDCDTPIKMCNIMSYCRRSIDCDPYLKISKEQRDEARKWASSYPRNQVITKIEGQTNRIQILEYTKNIEPAQCHFYKSVIGGF